MRLKLGFASLGVALLVACSVYVIKDRVSHVDGELRRLRAVVAIERARLHRLRAEWAVLSQPTRLARLAAAHLQLQPARPGQILSIADLPLRIDLTLERLQLQALLPSGAEVPLRLKPHRLSDSLRTIVEALPDGR